MTGLIQVYTGTGKGKTTASIGLAVRAAGHGKRVHILHLMKAGKVTTGEDKLLSIIPNITIESVGGSFVYDREKDPEVIKEQLKPALKRITSVILKDQCDVLILDEINVALNLGLMGTADIVDLLKRKPTSMEVVCTGRGAPQELLELADLITELREVKHPFSKGIKARKGIEF